MKVKTAITVARGRLASFLGVRVLESEGFVRYKRIACSAVTALAGRGVAAAVSFATVPLTVSYLGAERYGAWMTISTMLAWFQLADIGVGNGLVNALAEARGNGERGEARSHVATALWGLTVIAFVLVVCFCASWPWVPWASVFNVHSDVARSEIGPAMFLAEILFAAALPLSVVFKILLAHQEGAVANLWTGAGNLASLAAIIAVTRVHGGMVLLVGAVSGARLLVAMASVLWLLVWHHPHLRCTPKDVTRRSVRRIFGEGSRFFVIQVAFMLIFSTDNIIIAHLLGAEMVTPYSVAWRLFTVPSLFVSLVAPYLWPAYADALVRGDSEWIVRTLRRSVVVSVEIASVLAVLLVVFGEQIIARWAGPAALSSKTLLIWMGCWSVLYAGLAPLAAFLNGMGRLRGQTIYGVATAIANIALSVWLCRMIGVSGVIAGTVLAYLICGVGPSVVEVLVAARHLTAQVSFCDATKPAPNRRPA